MNMTLKEMMLQFNDRMSYMEEQLEFQHEALHSLTESCALIAEGVRTFIDDFYGPLDKQKPVASIKLPIAVDGDILEKMKDPKYMKKLADKFKKEAESMSELEDELEKIQEQIVKGEMGES